MAEQYVHISNDAVRDPTITQNDFCVLIYLKWFSFEKGVERQEFDIDSSHIKHYLGFADNRPLKKCFSSLYENGYLNKPILNFVQNKPIKVSIDRSRIDAKDNFTRLPVQLLYMLRDGKISTLGFRLVYYYESRINRNSGKLFCFPSRELICSEIGIKSEKTITTINRSLKNESKIIDYKEQALESTLEYDSNDRLVRTKMTNHYYVKVDEIMRYK